jgi:[ribosomal protein S5]-alanine N-acetyltransferase
MSPTLKGSSITLREPRESDIDERLDYGKSVEISKMYGADTELQQKPLSRQELEEWLKDELENPNSWVIEYNGRAIGNIRLHSLSKKDRNARLAIGLFTDDLLGKGLGTEATNLVLKFAFENLELHRIDLRVLEFNERAIASYKKAGFVAEGVEREAALIDGEWHNDLIMSILEQEYIST